LLPAAPAQAQAARTFVSAAGSDSNNCTNVATPCRHFAAAYAATAAEGEIDVLDPANYGQLIISQGISVQGHGWASVSAVTGGASITINGGDKINISGVILDGGGAANSTGIAFNSGGSLTVRDSVIRNFSRYGILFVPNTSTLSQLFVSNTLVSDIGTISTSGIQITPTGTGTVIGVLERVEMVNNVGTGLVVEARTQTINVTVSDSVSANNRAGIYTDSVSPGATNVMVRNSFIANNSVNGLGAGGGSGATIRLTRSTITGNFRGWANVSATFLSYGDNNIDGNTTVSTETAPPNPLTYK
jgi:hypothetical protein